MKSRALCLMLTVFLNASLAVSCMPKTAPKTATFIFTQEPDVLNPLYTNMWFSAITQQIWNCWAWDFDDQNNPHPVLVKEMPSAENGGISPDGRVITLKLRDDIVWSDGQPITSEDFVFTYEMVMNPQNTVASTFPYDKLEKVEAPDARTVVMTFKEPFAAWQATLWHGLLPAHVLRSVFEKEGTIDNAEWNRAPTVGCGPFVFKEWESGSFARFVANEKYWLGRPKIDEIFIRFVPDDASQVAALKAGDGDLGTFIAYSDIPTLEQAGVKMVKVFSGYNEGWYFYLHPEKGHPALKDVQVRQAIALAFDRFSICKDLLLGLTKPPATYWANTPWEDPTLEPWPYDPERAKQLLDEAGWKDTNGDGVRDKDGVELVLTLGTTTREIRRDVQAVAQQQLAQVGIKLELANAESDIFFGSYGDGGPCATGQYDIFQYSTVTNYPDPETADWLCKEIPSDENPAGVNWQSVCDEELDALFQLQATQVDFAERQKTFHKISRIVFERVYWLGIWEDPDIWAVGPRLKNVRLSGATPFFNIVEWELSP
ncbi:MAG: peptide ABC transporter substrate-binding protein [Anaerolineae bacterium]|nr:peptide ABC transporter substrate-binding protein [Anaerolineae bacterium]MDW8067731.1 peptide ABC transporter substrate-binding protein [Anaerolineae bacterium]